ncbi:MAG: helix-hairpin-helix domain-containing protein, partial [Ruminococcus sp.]|nr:helix-hairpin-helix domain-containing protein [Ruminococcus sp.]
MDKESEKSTVIVVNNPQGIEEKITSVSSECTTSVITEKITDMRTTSLLSETTVISSTVTTVVSELKQPVTEEILYLDINSAGFDDLVKLKGIGEHLAEQIISYREEYGGFSNIEELMNVSGIGEKIFNSICDYVYVENPVYYSETEVDDEIEVIDETAELPAEPAETEATAPVLTLEEIAPINLNEADI